MIYTECKKHKEKILSQWLADFLRHHSIDAIGVSRTVNDRFLNPVGHVIKNANIHLYDAILGNDIDAKEISSHMQELMRVQAVQQLSPAQALAPFTALKQHIYTLTEHSLKDKTLFKQYLEIINRIDTLMLMAFDIYVQDKENLFQIRVKELKSAQSQILRFAQLKGFPTDDE